MPTPHLIVFRPNSVIDISFPTALLTSNTITSSARPRKMPLNAFGAAMNPNRPKRLASMQNKPAATNHFARNKKQANRPGHSEAT